MKAVVLEIRDGVAAVLKEDGSIVKVSRVCSVGETIEINDNKSSSGKSKLRVFAPVFATAAAAAAAIGIGVPSFNYFNIEAYAYVSVDVNPSIEYALSRADKVVGVEAVNDEAKEIVDALNAKQVRFKTLEEALTLTEEVLKENGYLGNDDEYMLVNISTDDDNKTIVLETRVGNAFNANSGDSVTVDIATSGLDDRQQAKELGISTGRFDEIRKIEAEESAAPPADVNVNKDIMDKYKDHSVKDLLEAAGRIEGTKPLEEPTGGEGNNTPPASVTNQSPQDAGTTPAPQDARVTPSSPDAKTPSTPQNERETIAPGQVINGSNVTQNREDNDGNAEPSTGAVPGQSTQKEGGNINPMSGKPST